MPTGGPTFNSAYWGALKPRPGIIVKEEGSCCHSICRTEFQKTVQTDGTIVVSPTSSETPEGCCHSHATTWADENDIFD